MEHWIILWQTAATATVPTANSQSCEHERASKNRELAVLKWNERTHWIASSHLCDRPSASVWNQLNHSHTLIDRSEPRVHRLSIYLLWRTSALRAKRHFVEKRKKHQVNGTTSKTRNRIIIQLRSNCGSAAKWMCVWERGYWTFHVSYVHMSDNWRQTNGIVLLFLFFGEKLNFVLWPSRWKITTHRNARTQKRSENSETCAKKTSKQKEKKKWREIKWAKKHGQNVNENQCWKFDQLWTTKNNSK